MQNFLDSSRLKAIPRRWLIAIITFAVLIFMIAAGAQYRHGHPRQRAFPIIVPHLEFADQISVKEFVKPPDVTIVGLVFFGRKNRVEMLRCYLEVSSRPTSKFGVPLLT